MSSKLFILAKEAVDLGNTECEVGRIPELDTNLESPEEPLWGTPDGDVENMWTSSAHQREM